MAISYKKSKASPALPALRAEAVRGPTEPPLTVGLDLSNRSTRTPIGWILDPSPSVQAFTEQQLASAKSLVADLRKSPATAQTVVMNMVQIGSPPPSTGFSEIERFQVPEIRPSQGTPLHKALDRMTDDLGRLFADFRASGTDRTDSVVIITTDGEANGCSEAEFKQSITRFLDLGKKWSVTNFVVGVGSKLDEAVLKSLTNGLPPIRLESLNAECLTPFIKNVAECVSRSRRGQEIDVELPRGAEPIE